MVLLLLEEDDAEDEEEDDDGEDVNDGDADDSTSIGVIGSGMMAGGGFDMGYEEIVEVVVVGRARNFGLARFPWCETRWIVIVVVRICSIPAYFQCLHKTARPWATARIREDEETCHSLVPEPRSLR